MASKEWYQKNKKNVSEYNKNYRLNNRSELEEKRKKYVVKNKIKILGTRRKYSIKNKIRISANSKKYYKKNRDKLIEYTKQYRSNNKDKCLKTANTYQISRRKTDIQFKLGYGLRCRLCKALKENYKSGSAVRDLGCTIPELKIYLENQFQPGMTWGNWSVWGWHIDHKKALFHFDLTDREQFLEACNYTNLQPMWAKENLEKSNRLSWQNQETTTRSEFQ